MRITSITIIIILAWMLLSPVSAFAERGMSEADVPSVGEATYGSGIPQDTGDVGIQNHGSPYHCTIHAETPRLIAGTVIGGGWHDCSPTTMQRIVEVCHQVKRLGGIYWQDVGCAPGTDWSFTHQVSRGWSTVCKSGTWTYRVYAKGEYWDPVMQRFYSGAVGSAYPQQFSC